MEYEGEVQVANFIAGLLVGAVIGASAALLLAPQSGRRTRKRLTRAAGEVATTAGDRWESVSDDVRDRVDDVRTRVDDTITVARKRIRA